MLRLQHVRVRLVHPSEALWRVHSRRAFSRQIENVEEETKKSESAISAKNEKNEKTPASFSDVKRLFTLYKPEKGPLMISTAALTVSTAITMSVPAGMGKIIDLTTAPDAAAQLPYVAGVLGGLFFVGSIANFVRINTSNMIGERIGNRLRKQVFNSIMDQEIAFYDATRTGELVNRLSSDTALVGAVLSDNVTSGLRSTAQGVASISMLFTICPKLAVVMCLSVPPVALGAVSYGKFVRKMTADVQKKLSGATELAEERISNIRTVRWFSAESSEKEGYKLILEDVIALAQQRSYASAGFFGAVDLSMKFGLLAVLGYGGSLVTEGLLSVGELTSFLLYTLYVGFSFAGMSSFYSELMRASGASLRIFQILEREPRTKSTGSAIQLERDLLKGLIRFTDVSFAYPSRPEARILNNFDFTVEPNTTVALVGPSGCGKSTLAGLLGRIYELDGSFDPQGSTQKDGNHGTIWIDDIDISTVDPTHLRSVMAIVTQEPPLFATSIADNIAYGISGVTQTDIEHAARLANAHDFIMKMPNGYETYVGERGQTLSGGQKQRVAIARALLRNPRILILDEATSALDMESERLIQDAISKIRTDRTVLMITHRFSTMRSADKIAVLDKGRVAEEGTYEDLLAKNGRFKEMLSTHELLY